LLRPRRFVVKAAYLDDTEHRACGSPKKLQFNEILFVVTFHKKEKGALPEGNAPIQYYETGNSMSY
jgi:hypothetical protein